MKRKIITILFLSVMTVTYCQEKDNTCYISPNIGGVGWLLKATKPVIHLPFQMIRMTPSRKDYLDDQISDFPLVIVSHFSDPVFSIKPNEDEQVTATSWDNKLDYDQDEESLKPWHYSNFFPVEDISVEFIPGKKCGIYRFVFPKNKKHKILFGTYNKLFNYWKTDGSFGLTGMQYFNTNNGNVNPKVYMYGNFNCRPAFYSSNNINVRDTIGGNGQKIYCTFNQSDSLIEFRYAISFINEKQAKQNYLEELSSVSAEKLATKGKGAWSAIINRVQVEGGSKEQKESFYTALYRCCNRMVNISEDSKFYSGYDNQIHEDSRPFYVDDAIWDTYLALHPLRMILQPLLEEDMLQSYVRMYQQSRWMPTFPSLYGDVPCMNGFHSSILFLNAYEDGLQNIDYKTAYEGMLKNSKSATMLPWKKGPATILDSFYYKHGYFPALLPNENEPYSFVHTYERRQSVAVTLGVSYDDWATAQLAKVYGQKEDYELLNKKSENYLNLWDANKKFFMPKDSSGNWIPIDPKWDGGPGGRNYYDENNGWTYLWQVQQDIPKLIKLMGGEPAFEQKLDQLFHEDLGRDKRSFWSKFPDATGLVGQYSMGNEPSFFIPYLYDYTSAPWKTQERIRVLLHTWFYNDIFGMPGDEDGGGMSAFIVFSSLGFYPVTPGKTLYAIGSPIFIKSSIYLQNDKVFTIIANHSSESNKYIQSARLNGKNLNSPFFTYKDIMDGGTLELQMSNHPNKNWGVNTFAASK